MFFDQKTRSIVTCLNFFTHKKYRPPGKHIFFQGLAGIDGTHRSSAPLKQDRVKIRPRSAKINVFHSKIDPLLCAQTINCFANKKYKPPRKYIFFHRLAGIDGALRTLGPIKQDPLQTDSKPLNSSFSNKIRPCYVLSVKPQAHRRCC